MDATERLISTRPFVIRRRVIWGECDPAAVVYTPRFSDYAVSARDWFMRTALGFNDRPELDPAGISFPMRAMSFDFLGFLAADDLFDMTVAVAAISTRTFTLSVAGTREDGSRCFEARMTCVGFDRALGKAVPLPDGLRAALLEH